MVTFRALDLISQSALAGLAACALASPALAAAPHGPGHYEESSGFMRSPGCNGAGYRYSFSTPAIAPGHAITNFRFELRGDNKCGQARRWKSFDANCELATDKADRKTVVFQLFAHRDQCFAAETFEPTSGASHTAAGRTTDQHGAVTVSQMVFTYDVQ